MLGFKSFCTVKTRVKHSQPPNVRRPRDWWISPTSSRCFACAQSDRMIRYQRRHEGRRRRQPASAGCAPFRWALRILSALSRRARGDLSCRSHQAPHFRRHDFSREPGACLRVVFAQERSAAVRPGSADGKTSQTVPPASPTMDRPFPLGRCRSDRVDPDRARHRSRSANESSFNSRNPPRRNGVRSPSSCAVNPKKGASPSFFVVPGARYDAWSAGWNTLAEEISGPRGTREVAR